MSIDSSSNNTLMDSPASSITGSVLAGPPGDDESLSTSPSTYSDPKTVLAVFFYRFTTFLDDKTQRTVFNLRENPVDWPNIQLNNGNWVASIQQSIDAIARERNGAAKLLLVILWSHTMIGEENAYNFVFWDFASYTAGTTLFKFQNAPEQYLGWVKNVHPRNKGHFHDIVSENGLGLFKVDSRGILTRLSESEGLELAENTIGELPMCTLAFV